MENKTINAALRRIEANYLDVEYKKSRLWNYDSGIALYGLLTATEGFRIVIEQTRGKVHDYSISKMYKHIEGGFMYAYRWFIDMFSEIPDPIPTTDVDVIEYAGELILLASRYSLISVHYMMYGSGFVTATVNSKENVVRFFSKNTHGQDGFVDSLEAAMNKVHRQTSNATHSEVVILSPDCVDGRIVFLNILELAKLEDNSDQLREVIRTPDNLDVFGVTFNQYLCFWKAMRKWSIGAQEAYLQLALAGVPQEFCSPAQVIPKDHYYSKITKLSKLHIKTIKRIVQMLSFWSRKENLDVFLQPLFVSDKYISWCPLTIISNKFERNIIKLLSLLPESRNKFANIIGERATIVAHRVVEAINHSSKYKFQLDTYIEADGLSTDIDLIMYSDKYPEELLLCEIKAVLSADSFNELKHVTSVINDAQIQLRKAQDILCVSSLSYKEAKFAAIDWNRVRDLCKVVITPESYPLPVYSSKEYPVVTLDILETFLDKTIEYSPKEIVAFCTSRQWVSSKVQDDVLYEDINVGGITFQIPYRMIADAAAPTSKA